MGYLLGKRLFHSLIGIHHPIPVVIVLLPVTGSAWIWGRQEMSAFGQNLLSKGSLSEHELLSSLDKALKRIK